MQDSSQAVSTGTGDGRGHPSYYLVGKCMQGKKRKRKLKANTLKMGSLTHMEMGHGAWVCQEHNFNTTRHM